MGRATGISAAWSHMFVWLLVLASTAASEGVTLDTSEDLPGMLETALDCQLQRQTHEKGRESSSSYLHAWDARAGVLDGDKGDVADILMFPAKIKSVVDTTCSYTLTIRTSCSSPKITRDAISLSFGDGHSNQVYAARLDDPSTLTFEQCSTDAFQIQGPCGGKTCYLYFKRSGNDGLALDWVKVAPSNSNGQEVTFYFNAAPLPADTWYGFNLCSSDSGGGSSDGEAVRGAAGIATWMVLMLLLLVLQPRFFRVYPY